MLAFRAVTGNGSSSGRPDIGTRISSLIVYVPPVGLADLSYGIAGVMAPSFGRGFWLATIIVFSIFMLGAAVGHARSMLRDHNFAPGNAGYFFYYDIVAPILLIVLYVLTR